MFAGSFVIPKLILGKRVVTRHQLKPVAQQIKTALIVRYGLLEACSLLGLAAALIGREWQLVLPMWALSVTGFLLGYPSDTFLSGLQESDSPS